MQIEVEKVEAAGTSFVDSYAPNELVLDDQTGHLRTAAEVSGRVSRKGKQIRLQGSIKTNVEVRCDRCLNPVAVPIDTDFNATYVPVADEVVDDNRELQEEDLTVSVFDDSTIDVDELVREQVLLALPTRLLCHEECRGLCPSCGADLNVETCSCGQREIDPRWAALKDLHL